MKRFIKLLVIICLALFMLGSIAGNAAIVSDDFNDNVTSYSWDFLDEGGPTCSETNSRLEIVLPADSSGVNFGAGYKSTFILSGNFDAQIDFQLIDWPATNGVRIGLGLGGSVPFGPSNVERVSFGRNENPIEVYATHFNSNITIIQTGDTSGKLRLVREGNYIYGYYFNAGVWTTVGSSLATFIPNEVLIACAAWSHDSYFADTNVKIAFDNFTVTADDLLNITTTSTQPTTTTSVSSSTTTSQPPTTTTSVQPTTTTSLQPTTTTTTIQPTTTTTILPTNAKLDMKPETINLKRRAQFIAAIIKLPEGYKARDVDVEAIKLCIVNNAAEQVNMDTACGDFKPQWAVSFLGNSLIVSFPNQGVLDLIKENIDMDSLPAMVTFSVQCNLKNGGPQFEVTDTVRVINSRWWQRK